MGGFILCREMKHSLLKFPSVDCNGILCHIRETDGFHFLFEHLAGLKFCPGTSTAVSEDFVGTKLFHPFCKTVRIVDINMF